jgi:hypothetical protein
VGCCDGGDVGDQKIEGVNGSVMSAFIRATK